MTSQFGPIEVNRSCYTCRHYLLCYKRHAMDAFVRGAGNLNLNGKEALANFQGLFSALAACCLDFLSGEPWVSADFFRLNKLAGE